MQKLSSKCLESFSRLNCASFFHCFLVVDLITGSTASSATRRYLVYSEADFEVFRPAEQHVALMG